MKKIYSLIIPLILFASGAFGQAAWVEPNPANVNDTIKLFVDVSQPDCGCPLLINAESEGDSLLYVWTWEPAENATISHGDWNNSADTMAMTYEGNKVWSYKIIPTLYYAVDASIVYETGISFLVKKKNGEATPDGEPKSEDFNVEIKPLACVDKVCPFPQNFREDDYFTVVYDNSLEENPGLQNIDPELTDVYFLPIAVAGGMEYKYTNNEFGNISEDHPELKMTYDGDSKWGGTMFPRDFFREAGGSANPVPENVPIEFIRVRFRVTEFTGNISAYDQLEVTICD